ncbi:MAG: DNRLRE domain-containing protein [Opitutaceae bacterium]|nr:DNRLRE domain-containing protein [Opitutaceae bacterium]
MKHKLTYQHIRSILPGIVAILVALPVFAAAAANDPISVSVSADAWIRSDNKNQSSANASNAVGQISEGGNARALLRFDFSEISLPENATFASVSLVIIRANVDSSSESATVTFNVHELTTSFNESATWNKSNASDDWTTAGGGGDYDSIVLASADLGTKTAIYTPDSFSGDGLNSIVKNALENGSVLNLLIKTADEDTFTNRHLIWFKSMTDSNSNLTSSANATLLIEYTMIPEPATTAALFAGVAILAAIGILRRRRRHRHRHHR